MSNLDEIFDLGETEKVKKPRKKVELSEDKKIAMLERLAKGREMRAMKLKEKKEGKEVKVNEYDDFNTESSSVFFSQLANKLKNFLKNEIDLSGIEIDGVEIPEEEHLNDAVEGMMEVLGVVMKGKAYTVGEKEVSPEFLNRFK
jgi:hypothetical protein